jgi:hypothetical protein
MLNSNNATLTQFPQRVPLNLSVWLVNEATPLIFTITTLMALDPPVSLLHSTHQLLFPTHDK